VGDEHSGTTQRAPLNLPVDESRERRDLLARIERVSDPVMAVLGVVFLGVLVVDLANVPMTPDETAALKWLTRAIYVAFVVDFLVRLLVAPDRKHYLRQNWLLAISLVLPMLRPLSFARVVPAAHAVTASQMIAGANHALSELKAILRGRAFFWLSLIATLVVLIGSGVVFQVDRSHPDTPFQTFGDAFWWGATLITTINSSDDPVSASGRMIAFLMRVFAMGVFGYLTASVASYFVKQVEPGDAGRTANESVPDDRRDERGDHE
jgi:voltage-gated potassium channel